MEKYVSWVRAFVSLYVMVMWLVEGSMVWHNSSFLFPYYMDTLLFVFVAVFVAFVSSKLGFSYPYIIFYYIIYLWIWSVQPITTWQLSLHIGTYLAMVICPIFPKSCTWSKERSGGNTVVPQTTLAVTQVVSSSPPPNGRVISCLNDMQPNE